MRKINLLFTTALIMPLMSFPETVLAKSTTNMVSNTKAMFSNQTPQEKALKSLEELAQMCVDTAHAYNQAVDKLYKEPAEDSLIEKFKEFHKEKLAHLEDLSNIIRDLGGHPPAYTKDFTGYVLRAYIGLKEAFTDTKGLLSAMISTLKLTSKYYDEVLKNQLDDKTREAVKKQYDEDRKHLNFIRTELKNRQ